MDPTAEPTEEAKELREALAEEAEAPAPDVAVEKPLWAEVRMLRAPVEMAAAAEVAVADEATLAP